MPTAEKKALAAEQNVSTAYKTKVRPRTPDLEPSVVTVEDLSSTARLGAACRARRGPRRRRPRRPRCVGVPLVGLVPQNARARATSCSRSGAARRTAAPHNSNTNHIQANKHNHRKLVHAHEMNMPCTQFGASVSAIAFSKAKEAPLTTFKTPENGLLQKCTAACETCARTAHRVVGQKAAPNASTLQSTQAAVKSQNAERRSSHDLCHCE